MEPTADKIVGYIRSKGQVTATDLSDYLGISRQAAHRQINNLQKDNIIYKIGRAPKVFYLLATEKKLVDTIHIDTEVKKLIDENSPLTIYAKHD